MIDPLHSLAFTVQANPGVYAIILGSGVSRSAKIPTGWEITLELVRKLARLHGEECDSNPEEWHRSKFGTEPDYSKLLDEIARTQAERQQLLQGYFEATEEERDEGSKQPTVAHRAIADLVAGGFVRVIITTNFDRLLERALEETGITPTIIGSADHIKGALPLVHTKCCVVKVHGDYKDTRILNTPGELASYPVELNDYLDRIFDEFGLIVCGWSAEWDEALRSSIARAPNRRFSTYWASRGEPGPYARDLIRHRSAQVIKVQGGDHFFQSLSELVKSLQNFSRIHPLSREAAVASLKRYLSEDRFHIQLADLIGDEVDRVVDIVRGPKFPCQGGPAPDSQTLTHRVRSFESVSSTMISLAVVGGSWSEPKQSHVWEKAIARLMTTPAPNGYTVWNNLLRYPAVLITYALGISAILSDRLDLINKIMTTKIRTWQGEDELVIRLLPPIWLFENGNNVGHLLEGMDRRHAPLNDWIYEHLRPYFKKLVPDDGTYEYLFDQFEILIALNFAAHMDSDQNWVPVGCFGYRQQNKHKFIKEIQESIVRSDISSPFVSSGLLPLGPVDRELVFTKLDETMSRIHWW